MAKYWIVWNETRTEGFITNDRVDAEDTSTGEWSRFGRPSVGEAMHDAYEDSEMTVQEVDL